MNNNSTIEYKINENDEIVFVSDDWDRFALENDAPDVIADKVLNRSLWDFVSDETTRQLYKDMIGLARTGKAMQFNFYCDSPEQIRCMEMTILPENEKMIRFHSQTITVDERLTQKILDRKAPRTDDLLSVCSWCKAVNIQDNNWKPIDEGISILGLFEEGKLPQLSHGMCDACFEQVSEQISRRKLSI